MDISLIKKYNVQGPRYTSYPTVVQFKGANDSDLMQLKDYLINRNKETREISLYFHIPFCFSLCWYCGCTKIITRKQERGDLYLDYLEKEVDQIAELLHEESEVIQIHFGGGTPTFLTPNQLRRLGAIIRKRFNLTDKTEFGVEIDPRRCSREHVTALRQIGCNRASLGVQDTNENVQEAIHRIQPFAQTRKVIDWLREERINSINVDLIYGLPRQTLDTFRQTMDDVLKIEPDRLAIYSYAHLPQLMPAQKLLNIDEMPSTNQKLAMLQLSISHLTQKDYRFIGMDHFSREDEELSRAMDDGTLQRNFQGYSTHSGADLYAFGMSGISNVGTYYWQNHKDLNTYYASLEKSKQPVAKVFTLTKDDLIRQEVIMQVMCRMGVDKKAIEHKWDIDFDQYFHESISQLQTLQDDSLVQLKPDAIDINEQGRLFLRNIAMCFDKYLSQRTKSHKFSKTI